MPTNMERLFAHHFHPIHASSTSHTAALALLANCHSDPISGNQRTHPIDISQACRQRLLAICHL
eukprot:scaffold180127_cov18-Tisochrysis_lutea.AAC.2